MNILLVEDNREEARFLTTLLEEEGDIDAQVIRVGRLSEGLAQLEVTSFDVLLLDLHLPDSQGLQTFTKAKAHADHLPILILTGFDDANMAMQAVREGAQDYIPKQRIDGYLLSRSIHYAIERKRAEKALARQNEELALLHRISQRVGQSLDVQEVLNTALAEVLNLNFVNQDIQRGVIFLKEPHTERVETAATYHVPDELPCLQRPIKVGECLCGRAIELGEILTSESCQRDPRHTIQHQDIPDHCNVCIPLKAHGDVIGVLTMWLNQAPDISEAEKRLLEAIANHIAIAAENARLYERARNRAFEMDVLNRTAQYLTAILELDRVFQLILREVRAMLDVEAASVWLYESTVHELVLAASAGPGGNRIEGLRIPASEGIVGWVVQSWQPILVDDAQTHSKLYSDVDAVAGTTTESLIAVPLRSRNKIIGVIEAINPRAQPFDQHSLLLLTTLAGAAAVAIENARLYEAEQEQRRLLQESQGRLVQSEKLVATGKMAASLAHEINNPLQAIHNSLQTMLAFDLPPKRREEYLQIADEEVERLIDMVKRIVSFSRPTEQKLWRLDINQVIQKVLDLSKKYLQHRHVTSQTDLNADLPPVKGNPTELGQVFLNLVLNAVEAMPEGGILTISSFLPDETARIGVSFTDTGVGIPSEDLHHLFEPFFSTKEEGTGLGLSISYSLVERHGGEITVCSEVNQGTTFTVWLPLQNDTHDTNA
jgi:signal transduction histidine kinase/DNA-binding response OmpR family regulator